MAKTKGVMRSLLIWTYERGTLQYDIICALILAFIFFVPRSCFTPKRSQGSFPGSVQQTTQHAPRVQSQHP